MSAARVELRDIATEDEVQAVMGLRRAPGQERYLGSMISHFEDAVRYPEARPRMWSAHDADTGQLVGFVMISDDIPEERLAADDEIVGPYFLWRLLIDERFQGRGYGAATIEAIADYVAAKPNGATLLTSCADGDGSPLPFYIRHGFTHTGQQKWGEHLLALDLEPRREAAIGGPA
jgi:diamine N-acetyltransferase